MRQPSVVGSGRGRNPALDVDVHDLRGREAVEPGGRGVAVSADVFGVHEVVNFQFRKFFGERNCIQRITSLAKHSADLRAALFERLEMVLAMVEDVSGEAVIAAVVDVITAYAVANRFADDARD